MAKNKNIISIKDVKKSFVNGDVTTEVLKGVSLDIESGHIIAILGPSGSGKTTLLNILSGLELVDSGIVEVADNRLDEMKHKQLTKFRKENIGFVFQQYNLLPNLTAKENAEVGEYLSKGNGLSIDNIFELIDMTEQLNKFPYQLSGGQQQRVSVARAIAKNPKVLFCDEPTGALDEVMGKKVLEVIKEINKTYNTTIIMVTHNPHIGSMCDEVIRIANGNIVDIKKNKKLVEPKDINWS